MQIIQRSQRHTIATTALVILCLISIVGVISASGLFIWGDEFSYNEDGIETAVSVATADGKVFVASSATSNAENPDWFIRAYDTQTQSLIWEDQFDYTGNFDSIYKIAAQNDRVIVAGASEVAVVQENWILRAHDSNTGNLLWQDEYDYNGTVSFLQDLLVTEKFVIVVGEAYDENFEPDWVVSVHDIQTGALVWRDRYSAGGTENIPFDAEVSGNRLFVSGWITNSGYDEGWFIRSYNLSTGQIFWEELINEPGFEVAFSLAFDRNALFVAGRNHLDEGVVRAYQSKNGRLLWESEINIPDNLTTLRGIVVDRSQIYVAGSYRQFGSRSTAFIASLNKRNGNLNWLESTDEQANISTITELLNFDDRIYTLAPGNYQGEGSAWFLQAYQKQSGELVFQEIIDHGELSDSPRDMQEDNGLLYIVGTGNNNGILEVYDIR
ncbi:MAG: PQQ-binding-like beta-propeller repeat protein [Chloroflexota bacterium]